MVTKLEPQLCSGPLAAYRLGLLSETFRMWRDLFLRMPEFEEGTAQGVWLLFEQMNEAVLTLIRDIPVNVYSELRPLLQRRREFWVSIVNMVWDFFEHDQPWNSELIQRAKTEPHLNLCNLAKAACSGLSDKKWCELGSAIGSLQTTLYYDEEGIVPLSDVERIAEIVCSLPPDALRQVPVLLNTADLAPSVARLSPRDFLMQAVNPERAASYEMSSPHFDICVVTSLLHAYDNDIQAGLRGIRVSVEDHATNEKKSNTLKPEWNREIGELRFNNEVVRKVKTSVAKCVVLILDSFQELGWPRRIDSPLDPDPVRFHDAIASLNERLTKICFSADGSGKGIRWDLV